MPSIKGMANIDKKTRKDMLKTYSDSLKKKIGVDHRGINSMAKKMTSLRRAMLAAE